MKTKNKLPTKDVIKKTQPVLEAKKPTEQVEELFKYTKKRSITIGMPWYD